MRISNLTQVKIVRHSTDPKSTESFSIGLVYNSKDDKKKCMNFYEKTTFWMGGSVITSKGLRFGRTHPQSMVIGTARWEPQRAIVWRVYITHLIHIH